MSDEAAAALAIPRLDSASEPSFALGLAEVLDAEEPILLPLQRWRIDVGRFHTTQEVRSVVESREAQGCMVTEKLFSNGDISPLQKKLVDAYRCLCKPEPEKLFAWNMVLTEAIPNVVRDRQPDGGPFSPERWREGRATFGIEPQDKDWSDFLVYFRDSGKGFNPFKVLNPRNLENIAVSNGKGIFIMGYYMSVQKDAVGGRIMYLPMAESNDEDMLCNELLLKAPVKGTPNGLITAFRRWYREYTPPVGPSE